jgi:cytochrome c peroxidase
MNKAIRNILGAGALGLGMALASAVTPAEAPPSRYVWQALPAAAPDPVDNPATPAKVSLGKRLFFERRLSADGTLSCASCHDLYGHAGADGRKTAVGIAGKTGARNAPTVWNAAFLSLLFWDGRAPSLEEQAKGPILNPVEMGMPSAAAVAARLHADASYREEFARAFGPDRPITLDLVAKAIAAYERTLITADTPYDRYVRGDGEALDAAQLRGMALFETLGCVNCHQGPAFSDASILGGRIPLRFFPTNTTPYEIKYDLRADGGAISRHGLRHLWRVPSLRNVALTGPWLHNGSVDDLAEVVRIMASTQLGATVDAGIAPARPVFPSGNGERARIERRPLDDQDVADIVAFLHALSSDMLAAAAAYR